MAADTVVESNNEIRMNISQIILVVLVHKIKCNTGKDCHNDRKRSPWITAKTQ